MHVSAVALVEESTGLFELRLLIRLIVVDVYIYIHHGETLVACYHQKGIRSTGNTLLMIVPALQVTEYRRTLC